MGDEQKIAQITGNGLTAEQLQQYQDDALLAKAAYADFTRKLAEAMDNPNIEKDAMGNVPADVRIQYIAEALGDRKNISEQEIETFINRYDVLDATNGT